MEAVISFFEYRTGSIPCRQVVQSPILSPRLWNIFCLQMKQRKFIYRMNAK